MQRHGRTAPALFQEHAAAAEAKSKPGSRRESAAGGAAAAPRPTSGKAAAVLRNTSDVASRLVGGVGKAPIKLSSMPEAVNSEPEAVKWLKDIETDDGCADSMASTLEHADEVRHHHLLHAHCHARLLQHVSLARCTQEHVHPAHLRSQHIHCSQSAARERLAY